jgi:DNA-binding response OmpR family regulator
VPHLEGKILDFCVRLSRDYALPTIVLAERESSYDAVCCLDAGAEDFLHKPCDFSELTARVRAALRRQARRGQERVVAGPLQIDLLRREVRYGERQVRLGPTEFRLLEELVARAGRVVPAEELLRRVWRSDGHDTELLRVTIYRLRRKLSGGQQDGGLSLIRSIPGVGFMFDPQAVVSGASGGHVGA